MFTTVTFWKQDLVVLVLTNSQSTERIIPGLIWFAYSKKKKKMLLLFFSTSPRRVCGWTCICAYMCAEWEQGHSWGLGFLSEHHLQASLHPTGEPPLYSMSSLLSDWSFLPWVLLLLSCMLWWLHMKLAELNPGKETAKTDRAPNNFQQILVASSVQ